MPQEVQIVPKFQHPHVETYVNDYTQYDDEVSTPVDTNSKFIAVFRSPMGPDNVIIKKNDLTDFKKTYGKSDYSKYGQPLMMPIAMLSSGSATVYCMRVMPDDAYAANAILYALYQTDSETGKMVIKYRVAYIPKDQFTEPSSYKTAKAFKKALKQRATAFYSTTPDADGFLSMPIAVFRMQGRGVYGNNYRWRIARNSEYENDYGIKMYSFEIMSTTNGLRTEATYVGALVPSPKFTNTTLINDIMDDQDTGSTIMDVQVFDEYIEELHGKFVEFVNTLDESKRDVIPDVDEFDPFFGITIKGSSTNRNLEIVTEEDGTDDISVDRPQGTAFFGGDDGAFADNATYTVYSETPDGQTVETVYTGKQAVYMAENDAYIAAFTGELDRTILSSRRVPATAILDANYAFEVKQALVDLVNTRDSGMCYLDAGIDTTLSQIDNIIEQYADFNTRNISKNFQHYTVKDYETQKRCEVTITFFLAQQLAYHYENNGTHIPFVKKYAQLSGHIKNSLEPCIDDIDDGIKEKLYLNRINYFETLEENVFQRATQSTAQMTNSDLIEENNMNTLFELKSILEKDCWDKLYDFTSASDRAAFSEFEKAKLAYWEGSKVDTLNIEFDVNEWEAERSIVHCYAAVQFRNIMKRCIIEIDVNKRNFLD